MYGLTISVASALIAASLAIFQFVLPNALALILTGLLSEEQPAVTWSVASRFFLSSDWPTFLRSESVSTSGVSRKISLVTWTKPIGFLLIAVAAVTTPLGLYDDVSPTGKAQNVEFVYVPDNGLIGTSTPPRSDRGFKFSRMCAGYLCPGDPNLGNVTLTEISNYTTNATSAKSYYLLSPSISPALTDLYQGNSDDRSPSLSGYFDIQARQWFLWQSPATRPLIAGNASLLQPDYKYASSVLMDNRIEVVEGLIVDTKNGGIGFRNHSVPDSESLYGAEWEEDILWMQPESACVNTNLTARYTGVISSLVSGTADLVDRGGFVNLQKVNPYYTPPNTTRDYVFENVQADAFLYERAYYLAWGNNAVAMEYLNITDPGTNRSRISSTIGQSFNVNGSFTDVRIGYTTDDFFSISRMLEMISIPSQFSWNSTTKDFSTLNPLIKNPYNVTRERLQDHMFYCKGASGGDQLNISKLDIRVGFVAGPAMVINKTDPNNASSLTTWERPYYACAAATKMSIRTVRFRYNSTRFAKLSNLEVLDIREKVYGSDAGKPVWGFETPWWNETMTWNISLIEPLWGLIRKSTPTNRNISTLQSERFYIPASSGTLSSSTWQRAPYYTSYTPGTIGPAAAWSAVFGASAYFGDPYSTSDQRQKQFFLDMMTNSSSTSKLLNLMWTDEGANVLVGTRGIHTPRYQSLQNQTLQRRSDDTNFASLPTAYYPVYFLDRRVHYNWVYGIPALICVGLIGFVLAFAFVSFVCGTGTIRRLRWFMFNSTSGRVLASHKYPDLGGDKSVETGYWLKNVGHKPVIVTGYDQGFELHQARSIQKRPPAYERVAQREGD